MDAILQMLCFIQATNAIHDLQLASGAQYSTVQLKQFPALRVWATPGLPAMRPV